MGCIEEVSFGDRKYVGDSSNVNRWSISPCKAKLVNVDFDKGRVASNADSWSAGVAWSWVNIVKRKHRLMRTDLVIAAGWSGVKNQLQSTQITETSRFKGHGFRKKAQSMGCLKLPFMICMQTNWWKVYLSLNTFWTLKTSKDARNWFVNTDKRRRGGTDKHAYIHQPRCTTNPHDDVSVNKVRFKGLQLDTNIDIGISIISEV